MPSFTISTPTPEAPPQGALMVFLDFAGGTWRPPYAPVLTHHEGLAFEWEEAERVAPYQALLIPKRFSLRRLSFDLFLSRRGDPIDDWLSGFYYVAQFGTRIVLVRFPWGHGVVWRLTDLSIDTEALAPGSNAVTQATAHLTLTESPPPIAGVGLVAQAGA